MSLYKNNTEAFSQYLQSMVKLEELQKMTEDLDKELEDSQKLMSEIKSIFSNIPNGENSQTPLNVDLRREQLVQFLAADGPQMLMHDMAEAGDVDIGTILAGLKNHAEDLKKQIVVPENDNRTALSDSPNENLNLEQYAASFDEFSKRLANIKLNRATSNNRNTVLEIKLSQLCEDINHLTQMVQTRTKLTETNKSVMAPHWDKPTALLFDNLINKLLNSIIEATYLWQNRT